MADVKTEKQKVQEITEKLEQGLKELFESEKYKTYLNTMSKFHNYSFNNTMLIAMQKPDATLVAGYKAWQKNFDRHVKKGEKGIRILAPAPYKIKEEQEKLDPVTGEIMLDKNGMPVTEEVEIKIPAFRVVPVFDVSQTDGKELPDIGVNELSDSVEDYEDFMQALTEVSPVPITYEEIEGDAKGYFHTTDHRIAIQEGMSQSQTVKTAVHEVAHAKLHDRERNQETDEVLVKDRSTKEVEAESVAYTVCQHFGIDTSEYSFGYIAGWSSGRDMKELKSSLDTIRKTASELITGIEDRLAELQRDREAEQDLVEMAVEVDGMDMDRVIYYRVPAERESELYDKVVDLLREGVSEKEIAETLGIEYDRTWWDEDMLLLATTERYEQYELLNVRNIERSVLVEALENMTDHDRENIAAYLEGKGAYTDVIATQETKEFGEYHIDYLYRTDTQELTDIKAKMEEQRKSLEPIAAGDVVVKFSGSMGSEWEISKITNMSPDEVRKLLYDMALLNENEWDGNYTEYLKRHGAEMTLISSSAGLNEHAPQFFDFAYDADAGVSASTELPAAQQAENLINRIEHGATVFTDDERDLIVNYNYKLDDIEKTRALAEKLVYMIENEPVNEALTVIDAKAEIDALPDGMVGLSEMHEYGYSWNEMLPLTKEMAAELFGETVTVYQLHKDGSETLIEDRNALEKHEGLFGVEKDDWSAYLEHRSMKQALEESPADREAQLLFGSGDSFGIYQLKDTEETRDFRFMAMDYLEMKGIAVSKENYDLIYTAPLEENTSLEDIYTRFNIDHPADFKGHSLSVSDVVVLHRGGENTSHYVDSFGYREVPEFTKEPAVSAEHTEEKAPVMDEVSYYVIADLSTWAENSPERSRLERFDSISEAMEAFQAYRAKDAQYSDDKARTTFGVSMHGIEFDVIHVRNNENVLSLDFTNSSEAKESRRFLDDLQTLSDSIGIDKVRVHREMMPEEVKDFVKQRFEYQLKQGGLDDISLYMSRFDTLYGQGKMDNLLPTANQRHIVEDIPIAEWENAYINAEKQAMKKAAAAEAIPETTVTLTVAECGEFHSLGEFHENIASVEEAIAVWKSIPPERMNGIPSIGIHIHTEGTEPYEDVEMDLLSGKVIDLEVLDYVPDITDNPKAIEVIAELIDKLPDIEVRGSLEKWQAAVLASQIDQFSYDYDTSQYRDTVEDREAQVANIAEDIRNGNTGYLSDFLSAVISEGVREGITDIFGQGVDMDESEAVQTARKAKELLNKLAEYKPLAKVEELEEQNYNMIDNVLNNGAEKKEERNAGRVSVKEKLAEKKAVIEQRDKAEHTSPEKETGKKSQREM